MRVFATAAVSLALAGGLGLALASTPSPVAAQVAVGLEIRVGYPPPPLPVYVQPPCPGYGWFWVPGYWAWDPYDDDYYWVPGAWVEPPRMGWYWTPPYWAFVDDVYTFFPGYWGPEVGYYGGIDYGFGYFGEGYDGGYWRGHRFWYNRAVNNLGGARFAEVYNAAPRGVRAGRASFNGPGGANLREDPRQRAIASGPHIYGTAAQRRARMMARADPALGARRNHGAPAIAATRRPGAFHGRGVARATNRGT
ncbi:MAG: hypothetical protein ACRED8_10965, partial [Caulobacteraceae bacterium]